MAHADLVLLRARTILAMRRERDVTTVSSPMACPVDGTPLTMSERAGIEIDYCPACRGVWLDRGELDKIIERNAANSAPAQSPPPIPTQHAPHPTAQDRHQSYQGHGSHGYKPHKRRKSFLEELFD